MHPKPEKLTIPEDSANRNAQPPERTPDPIPEGKLFAVQGFRQDGTRIERAEVIPRTHADAVEACKAANESPAAKAGAVWFGVVSAAEEKAP